MHQDLHPVGFLPLVEVEVQRVVRVPQHCLAAEVRNPISNAARAKLPVASGPIGRPGLPSLTLTMASKHDFGGFVIVSADGDGGGHQRERKQEYCGSTQPVHVFDLSFVGLFTMNQKQHENKGPYLTAPAVSPATIRLWKNSTMMTRGTVMSSAAAACAP